MKEAEVLSKMIFAMKLAGFFWLRHAGGIVVDLVMFGQRVGLAAKDAVYTPIRLLQYRAILGTSERR
jgi:hypothetical protein